MPRKTTKTPKPEINPSEKLYTTKETADWLRLSGEIVRQMARSGRIRCIIIEGATGCKNIYRFPESAILELLNQA